MALSLDMPAILRTGAHGEELNPDERAETPVRVLPCPLRLGRDGV